MHCNKGEETFFKKKAFFPPLPPIFKEIEAWGIFIAGKTFLGRKLFPAPLSKNLKLGKWFLLLILIARR